jgi:ankyrin repeat protein
MFIFTARSLREQTMTLADHLGEAALEGRLDEVQSLLDQGADPNAENSHGKTPLGLALLSDHPDVAQLLVERGAGCPSDLHTVAYKGASE